MRVTPIIPSQPAKNHLRRAMMIIHHDQHIVADRETGKQYPLPEDEAWKLYGELIA